MRLDKYLKVSRIIKRRTVAKEACENGRVAINDKVAKPSTDVKEGDIIEITFATRKLKAKIVNIAEHVRKEEAKEMYIIIEGEEDKYIKKYPYDKDVLTCEYIKELGRPIVIDQIGRIKFENNDND